MKILKKKHKNMVNCENNFKNFDIGSLRNVCAAYKELHLGFKKTWQKNTRRSKVHLVLIHLGPKSHQKQQHYKIF